METQARLLEEFDKQSVLSYYHPQCGTIFEVEHTTESDVLPRTAINQGPSKKGLYGVVERHPKPTRGLLYEMPKAAAYICPKCYKTVSHSGPHHEKLRKSLKPPGTFFKDAKNDETLPLR